METNSYNSDILKLSDIVDKGIYFNIPIYQRLYVWKEMQINTLLEDLYTAFTNGEGKEYYFLGGVMTVRNKDRYDLVDGQQRFTTLWMICMVISKLLKDKAPQRVIVFCNKDGKSRIIFSIRDSINHLFKDLQNDSFNEGNLSERVQEEYEHLQTVPDVKNIISAFNIIESFFSNDDFFSPKSNGFAEREEEIEAFANFILNKVEVIRTLIPEDADLNKIFELINGRGQQLSQTDILKAHILENLRKDGADQNEIQRYSEVWDACSDMSDYIEANIKREDSSKTWEELLKNKNNEIPTGIEAFGDDFLRRFISSPHNKITEEEQPTDLLSTINGTSDAVAGEDNNKIDGAKNVRSIVSFPMILLYTLRIFLLQNGENDIEVFNEKYLLKIFSPYNKWMANVNGRTEKFLNLLWKVRVAFDWNVVKFVKLDNNSDYILVIQKLRIDKNNSISVSRTPNDSITPMTQLQSMLYFSQPRIYEHWICPFIYKSFTENDDTDLLKFLQQLDNYLLCSGLSEDMIVRTNRVMKEETVLVNATPKIMEQDFSEKIADEKGCQFAHYLFYKMEYMLWYMKNDEETKRWSKYRITSKNSVEHISPQNPKWNKEHIKEYNRFGNLVLISREANSGYSNKSFDEKKAKYLDKFNNGYIDSLKSDVVYSRYDKWGDTECLEHLEEMKVVADKYFSTTYKQYTSTQDKDNLFRKWIDRNYSHNKVRLLQAIFAQDPEPIQPYGNMGYLPGKDDLYNMPESMFTYEHDRDLEIKPVDEFKHPIDYCFMQYPDAIKYCTCGQYRIYGDKVLLLDGTKVGFYNYQELLMLIVSEIATKYGLEVTKYTENYADYRYFNFYLHDNNLYLNSKDENSEEVYICIWYNYEQRNMCYYLDYSNVSHPNKFSSMLKEFGWSKVSGKHLYKPEQQYLCSFSNNHNYEKMAKKTVTKVKQLINSLLAIDFSNDNN